MPAVLRDRLVVVWAVLVVATVLSWGVGHDHTSLGSAGVVAALVIAFVKVRFVGLDFMELKEAPLALRVGFELWCVVVAAVVVVLYLLGSA